MTLSIQQKSIYLLLINATMISRSVGKSLKATHSKKTILEFKNSIFRELEALTEQMDRGKLTEETIVNSIDKLAEEFKLSIGQAQKPINVLLKYHFYLFTNQNPTIKRILFCPLDSIILSKIGERQSLTKINKEDFIRLQKQIGMDYACRIDLDLEWDKQHLAKIDII